MADENFLEKAAGFATDASIDTAADVPLNNVIDGIASHLPGGGAIDAIAKTGADLAVNNAINSKLGGLLGHHADEAPAQDVAPDDSQNQN